MSAASCPECTAKEQFWDWPGRVVSSQIPRVRGICPRLVEHQAGQSMCRVDIFHEADCPLLPHLMAEAPGFATAHAEDNLCDHCIPMFWWDMLSGSTTRFELRHADDCCAEAAMSMT